MRIHKHVWDLGTVFIPNSAFRPWFTHQTPFPQQPHRSLSSHCWLGNKKVYKTAARLPANPEIQGCWHVHPKICSQPNCFDMYCGCIFHAVMRCVHDHLKQSVLFKAKSKTTKVLSPSWSLLTLPIFFQVCSYYFFGRMAYTCISIYIYFYIVPCHLPRNIRPLSRRKLLFVEITFDHHFTRCI